MGLWTNRRGSLEPLLVSLVVFGCGNFLYTYAEACGEYGVTMVIVSRGVIGQYYYMVFIVFIGQNFSAQKFRWTTFFGGQNFGTSSKFRLFCPPKIFFMDFYLYFGG